MNQNHLQNYAARITPNLADFFNQRIKVTPKPFYHLLKNIKDFCLRGGKRLRPALVYYGYKIFNKRDSQVVFKASLITELIHTFLLIHDDIMDEDDQRRGGWTMHHLYQQEAIKSNLGGDYARHFGESMGILAGDLSYVLALEALSDLKVKPVIKLRLLKKLNQTISQTIFGQELDLGLTAQGQPTAKEVLNVYRLKTAQYSFEAPLHLGAILAKAPYREMEKLSAYALACGIAFQIKDDILGIFGNQKTTGKPVAADLKQGKHTLLIVKALAEASKRQRQKIESNLGNQELSHQDVEEIRSIIKNSGALANCENLAKRYVSQAKKSLEQFKTKNYHQPTVQTLNSLADFIIQRKV